MMKETEGGEKKEGKMVEEEALEEHKVWIHYFTLSLLSPVFLWSKF